MIRPLRPGWPFILMGMVVLVAVWKFGEACYYWVLEALK